jgi:hypothetical protein
MDRIMSHTVNDSQSALNPRPVGLHEAVDRWGTDLSTWPDLALIRRAREALLSDRLFRAHRDAALVTERRLKASSEALDKRIRDGGSLARIAGKLMVEAKPKPIHWARRIAAVAAVLVVAGALGSVVEVATTDSGSNGVIQVVQLDPLVFGPGDSDF